MTAGGFLYFSFVLVVGWMQKHCDLKLPESVKAALGFGLVLAYMAMTYGITAFLWERMP